MTFSPNRPSVANLARVLPLARVLTLAACAASLLMLASQPGQAAERHHHRHKRVHHQVAAYHPPGMTRIGGVRIESGPRHSVFVVDTATRRVLFQQSPDAERYPASLTKLMTLYLTFDALDRGQIRLDTELPVSEHAAAQEPAKIGVVPGTHITVEQAILAIVTKSANDAAVVLGEGLGGTEPAFAKMMNAEAQRLGMRHTVFRNASGLPNREQHTTARDMATLAMAILRNHHKYYHFFSTRSFTYDGNTFPNHDHLVGHFPGADGMKTGYIAASGFNLVTSAKRDGRRLVGVVFGGTTVKARDADMRHLLDAAFAGDTGTGTTQVAQAAPAKKRTERVVASHKSRTKRSHTVEVASAAAKRTGRVLRTVASHLNPVPAAMAHERVPEHTARDEWAVQVGAFNRHDMATAQAKRARKAVPKVLAQRKVDIETPRNSHDKLYRARLAGLTEKEARTACRQLQRKQLGCLVVMQ